MKKILTLLIFALLCGGVFAQDSEVPEFLQKLKSLKGVSDIEILQSNVFKEKYVIYFTQNIDHKNPQKGTFKQRVIVGFRGFDCPTVLVTEGYAILVYHILFHFLNIPFLYHILQLLKSHFLYFYLQKNHHIFLFD
ncbi:MAG: hypothetical protein IKO99_03675 [Bacteroidales bacterium]|nr:hypothetical protein [Bacteroidales bacterium]